MATVRPNLKGFAYANFNTDNYICSTGFAIISPNNMLDGEYIYQNLYSYNLQRQFHSKVVGSNYPALNNSDVNNLKFPFPKNKIERIKIAQILSTWDRAIEKFELLIKKYELRKKGLMQQLLSGKRRFKGFAKNQGYLKTKIGWIPEDWEVKKLKEIGDFTKGVGISKSELVESGLPAVRYGELYTRHDFYIKQFYSYISEESARHSKEIQSGDILFAGSGETLAEIGKCAAYLFKTVAYAGGDIIIFRFKKADSQFLGFILNHEIANRQKFKIGQGHSVVHIYSNGLRKLNIPIPSLTEQQKIASVLSTADKEIEIFRKHLENLKEQKKGLMQLLLTGKKRVKTT